MTGPYAVRASEETARNYFNDGGRVLVSEHGHLLEMPVTNLTTTHDKTRTTWGALVEQVDGWRTRYPNQRFYVVIEPNPEESPTVPEATDLSTPAHVTPEEWDGTRPHNGQRQHLVEIETAEGRRAGDGLVKVLTDVDGLKVAVYWTYPPIDPDDPAVVPAPYLVVDVDTPGRPGRRGVPAPIKVTVNDWTVHNSMTEDGL